MMRFAEFFAGIGLVRMGLERAGWKCAFANDIDPGKLEMYKAQFPDAGRHFKLGDIRGVVGRDLPEVELATASFPCTDLSLAGARKGLAGEHSSALWPFLELLDKVDWMRPPLVMLENVAGFLTSHGGADFKSALAALNRRGYAVDAFILDAARFVPQSRVRLFVVGVHEKVLGTAEHRKQYRLFQSDTRPDALLQFIDENQDINWRVRDLPPLPQRETTLVDILEILADDAPEWWNEARTTYLLNQMSERHQAVVREFRWQDGAFYGTVFRRVRAGKSMAELRTDGIAGCLRTPKGGSGRQILVEMGHGNFRARLLTPRECARLMGADDFEITVPQNQALFGFGDAVCVPAIQWIAENYLNPVLSDWFDRHRPEAIHA